MSVEIRPARPSDLDALLALEEASFPGDRISRRSYRRLIGRPTALVFVAEDEGAISGSFTVLLRQNSRQARLYSIAAARDGSGLGRALLAAAERSAAMRGSRCMRLEVRQDNTRAIFFYEKSGYQQIGFKMDYYSDGMTALRFEKPLADHLHYCAGEVNVSEASSLDERQEF
ncbi:GNAT family N-acetyltransferase [Pseudaminobacter sp. 19-2017]|uniref:GNAT family N-acetyltransferase n=1 Tax=Pseudaminobacter soli (ex Zhang et al. 2022) TaxID=2831468 RepID=A0A942E926_9HYPH|nr:N-acetyltransferase [Pseudaminobacter soli]MBS3650667.1 GNAT family N-acetyltransferase [Pseudaminobacter soli]